MLNTILGLKGKMSQSFIEARRVPITKISAGPCVVTQVKSPEKDGYWAIQLGIGEKRAKNITKPLQGHLKAAKSAARFLREVRLEKEPDLKIGDVIKLTDFFKK